MKMGRILVVSMILIAMTFLMAAPASACNPSTFLTIGASPMSVPSGETVLVTIEDLNDGDVDLLSPYVVLFKNGVEVSPAPAYVSGDDGDGIMQPGEKWVFEKSVQVTETTTFVAIGHATWRQYDITWLEDPTQPHPYKIHDPEEMDDVTVDVSGDGEGFTPGFWKNHLDAWEATDYSPGDSFEGTFGVDIQGFGVEWTLLDALNKGGGGQYALARHATAAILNASHPGVDYAMTAQDVIDDVYDAFDTGEFEDLKDQLDEYNNQGGEM